MKILIAITVLIFVGCSSKTKNFDQKFNELQSRMTQEKAQELLGTPNLKELKDGVETWHYNVEEGRCLKFEKNELVAFGRETVCQPPPSLTSATQPSPVADFSRQIGQDCKEDKECQSRNCHFKICSGKNNCQVPEGKVCAIDANCCTGFCDFGICRKRH